MAVCELIREPSALSSIYLCIFSAIVTLSESQLSNEDMECLAILPDDYKKYEVPIHKGKPTNVMCRFVITNLDEINEEKMDFGLHGYISTVWFDDRLILNDSVLQNSQCANYIWTPSIIFKAVEKKETFDARENIIEITKNQVGYSQRYSFSVGCRMFFKDYPFDTQLCVFPMHLLDSIRNDIRMEWLGGNDTRNSIYLAEDFKLLQYYLREPIAEKENKEISIIFIFVRRLLGSVINIYVPSTLIVAVSWVSFWIRVEAAPARVALSVTSLLTLCTQIQNHRSQLPPLNYIIALDIWLFVCVFMIFATLVEFAIAYNSHLTKRVRSTQTSRETNSAQNKPNSMWIVNMDENDSTSEATDEPLETGRNRCEKFIRICSFDANGVTKIDLICRVSFPVTFIIFSIAYWGYYLSIYNKK